MCIEDIKIGRRSTIVETHVPLSTTSRQLVGPNPRRTALVISAERTRSVTLSFNSPAVDGQCMELNPGTSPLQLDIKTHGQAVTKPIFAVLSAGTGEICVWETLFDLETEELNVR